MRLAVWLSATPPSWTQFLYLTGWVLSPFAVLHLATRRFRARREAVATLLAASIVLVAGSVYMLVLPLWIGPDPDPFVFILLSFMQFILLAAFLVVAWLLTKHSW